MVKCPKNYGAYDVSTYDCEECGKGKLYQCCRVGMDHLACAGWLHDETHEPHCCKHYTEKKENEQSNSND